MTNTSSADPLMHALPISLWEEAAPKQTPQHARKLREALQPYLSLSDLRRLAALDATALHTLLTPAATLPPEAVQGLLRVLATLLQPTANETITCANDLAALLMVSLGHLDHEEFWQICLDTKQHVQRLHCLYRGSLNATVVRVAEVFRLPLLLNSASMIVAHCHPSGSTEPSPQDIDMTRLLRQAGQLLEIDLLDHLIIGRGQWLSLREQRLGWEK